MRSTKVEQSQAKQTIQELQHLYARATDLIGMADESSVAEGRAIYHRIFASNANIGAAGIDPVIGPNAWVDVVYNALKDYETTQHLIGTQLAEVASLPDADGEGGQATLLSYVQAWHSTATEVWLFLGAYKDKVIYNRKFGWQISEMMLERMDTDRRARQAD